MCLFSGLGALGLVGPDEPRYAAIARAMAETHDWVTPRLWGTPWFEKPVLYYWTAGIAMRIFGVSEFAARLPSALAALLAVVAVAWTALRSYGVGAAWYSLLMLPTSVAMIGFSRAASPDMLFAGLLTAAMAVACEMLQKPRPGPILRDRVRIFSRRRRARERPSRRNSRGRRDAAVGRAFPPVARAVSLSASSDHRRVLRDGAALVRPVRVAQSGFSARLHLAAQFRAVLHAGFRAPPAVLVLWIRFCCLPSFLGFSFCCAALSDAVSRLKEQSSAQIHRHVFCLLGLISGSFFQPFSIEAAWVHPARDPPLFILLGHWVSSAMALKTKSVLRVLGWTGALLLLAAIPISRRSYWRHP